MSQTNPNICYNFIQYDVFLFNFLSRPLGHVSWPARSESVSERPQRAAALPASQRDSQPRHFAQSSAKRVRRNKQNHHARSAA
jgi:hypothetical protein